MFHKFEYFLLVVFIAVVASGIWIAYEITKLGD